MLGWLERRQLLLLAVVAVVFSALLAAEHWSHRSPPPVEFVLGPGLRDGLPIRVQVSGAVLNPGVYDLKAGDRVVDAIAAAGGPADDADEASLNLARRLRDEDQVEVARQAFTTTVSAPPGLVDLNSAPKELLDSLPGIGATYSQRIVDSRRIDGAFKTPQDLVDRKIVPRATYDRIRDLVTTSSVQ